MARATLGFLDAGGNFVPVKASRPLPTTGGGGGGGGAVTSVQGETGAVVLTAAKVGAADATATTTALAGKVPYPAMAPGQQNRIALFDDTGKVITYTNAVTTASSGAIPLRITGGHITLPVAAPTANVHAASKAYVDGAVLGSLKGEVITQAAYDALATKQPSPYVYIVVG